MQRPESDRVSYRLRKSTSVLIIKSTYSESAESVDEEFRAAKALLDHACVHYDVVEISGALEAPLAVNRHARQKRFPFRRAWDGYVVLAGILGDRSDQVTNRQTVTLELTRINARQLFNIGNGVMSEISEGHPAEAWGKQAVHACLQQIQDSQRMPLYRLFGKPKAYMP